MPSTPVRKAPRYCLHKATGSARVRIDGRTIWLGKHNSPESLQAYARLVAELSAGNDPSIGPVPEDLTILELVDRFLAWAKAHYRTPSGEPGHEVTNYVYALRPLLSLYGETPVRDFTPRCLKLVRADMIRRGWCRQSVNKQMFRVRNVFRMGVEEELVPVAVLQALLAVRPLRRGETAAADPAPVQPVDVATVDATLPWLPKQVRAMVQLQMLTGARGGEIRLLKRYDIDTSGEVWTARLVEHKNAHRGRPRTLLFGPQAQDILRPYLLRPADAYLFSPTEAVRDQRRQDRADSKRPPGQFYDKDAYARCITRACDLADRWAHGGAAVADSDRLVPRWHPHQLRHAAATMIRREFGLEAAAVMLGHASALITDAVYAERDEAKAKQIALKIG